MEKVCCIFKVKKAIFKWQDSVDGDLIFLFYFVLKTACYTLKLLL